MSEVFKPKHRSLPFRDNIVQGLGSDAGASDGRAAILGSREQDAPIHRPLPCRKLIHPTSTSERNEWMQFPEALARSLIAGYQAAHRLSKHVFLL